MRIRGFFYANNAPYITAIAVQNAFGLAGYTDFLVDSGASVTTIADSDAARLGIDYGQLERLPEGIMGVGGEVETFVIPSVTMVFTAEDRIHEEEMERVYVLRHGATDPVLQAKIERIPSLLGRDFLNRYALLLRRSNGTVLVADENVVV